MTRPRIALTVAGAVATALLTASSATTPTASAAPLTGTAQAVAAAPAATLGGGAYGISSLRSDLYGAQCDAGVAVAAIDRNTGAMNRFNVYSAAGSASQSRIRVTTGWTNVREWAQIDEQGLVLALFNDGHAEVRRWNQNYGYVFVQRFDGAHWAGVKDLAPQGRGVVYAQRTDGSMTYYVISATGKGIVQSGYLPATATGWGRATRVTGGGSGVVYSYEASSGTVWAQRKTLPYEGGGSWTSRVALATGIGDGVELASSGDGVVWLTRRDGGLYRIVQGNPLAGSGATSAPRRVASTVNWAYLRGLTADTNGCGDGGVAIRNRIRQLALSWNGTDRAFCTSHYCHPGWWCTDYAWGQWTDAGIGNTARFRVLPYDRYATPTSTSDPRRYGAGYGTDLAARYGRYGALQHAQVGDLVVWESRWMGGIKYLGHNAVITGLHRNSAGQVVSYDLMHGNWNNNTHYVYGVAPQYSHELGYPDAIVSPRL